MVSWNCWPVGTGCWPICPAATCRFCWLMAVTTSVALRFERGQLVGVEPGPQAVVALAQVGDAGDAGQPAQLVLDVDRRVVAEERAVVPAVRRDQVDDHQRVGRHLLDADALVLHQGGMTGSASETRFCTSTWAMSESMPSLKVTVRV